MTGYVQLPVELTQSSRNHSILTSIPVINQPKNEWISMQVKITSSLSPSAETKLLTLEDADIKGSLGIRFESVPVASFS